MENNLEYNMMTTKEKLVKYLKHKDISQEKFSRTCGFSSGFLKAGKHIGSDKLKPIRDNYPDLNMDWVLFDEGDMLINNVGHVANIAPSKEMMQKQLRKFGLDIIGNELTNIKQKQDTYETEIGRAIIEREELNEELKTLKKIIKNLSKKTTR